MDKVELQIHDAALMNWNIKGPFKEGKTELVTIDIHTSFGFQEKHNLMRVEVGADFYYPDAPKDIVLTGRVFTGFKAIGTDVPEDLSKYDVPDHLLITMLSIGISHARAILLTQSKASGLRGFVIPIVNPTDIFDKMKAKAKAITGKN